MTDFITTATRLVERGYSVIPIIPGEKRPGEYKGNQWVGMSKWQRYCERSPTKFELDIWAKWPSPSICLALGRASNVTAIDFDYGSPEVRAALEACLPPSPVKKVGAKGYTALYRGFAVLSKKYLLDGVSVIEVLAQGKQTVLPPSIHPDGMAYRWTTPDTLEHLTASELPELPHDIHDRIAKALEPFQSKVEKEQVSVKAIHARSPDDNDSYWRAINDSALLNLDSWVPKLFPDAGRGPDGGYRVDPIWRGVSKLTKKVGIHPSGIHDFGTDKGMTAIDLVMAATGADLEAATVYLRDLLGLAQEAVFQPEMVPDISPKSPDIIIPWYRERMVEPNPFPPMDAPSPVKTDKPAKKRVGFPSAQGTVGMLAQYINETAIRAQPVLAVAASLCAIGTLAGRKYRSPTNLRTNLYVVSLADSGAGKNHSRQVISRIFSDLIDCDDRLGGGKIASGSGLLTALLRSPSILFQLDEFGMFLSAAADKKRSPRHLTEIIEHMTELFTSSNDVYRGIEYADQRDRPRKSIIQPCLSIHGTTVPGHFWKALESSSAVDGSLARFIICESEEHYPDSQHPPEKAPPEQLLDMMRRIAMPVGGSSAIQLNGEHPPAEIMTVPYSEEATAFIKALEKKTTDKLNAVKGTPYTALWARRDELSIKVALIHAIGRNPEEPVIDMVDFDFALKIVENSIHLMVQGIERFVSDNMAESYTKRVLEVIRKAGGVMNKSALYKQTLFLGRDRDTTLKALLGSEDLVEEIIQPKGGGRPKTIYRLPSDAPF